jgi:hypothetical protein
VTIYGTITGGAYEGQRFCNATPYLDLPSWANVHLRDENGHVAWGET